MKETRQKGSRLHISLVNKRRRKDVLIKSNNQCIVRLPNLVYNETAAEFRQGKYVYERSLHPVINVCSTKKK